MPNIVYPNGSDKVPASEGYTEQFRAIEDDCIYYFNEIAKCYQKVCNVKSFFDLPLSVRRQIKAAKEGAAEIMKLPIE